MGTHCGESQWYSDFFASGCFQDQLRKFPRTPNKLIFHWWVCYQWCRPFVTHGNPEQLGVLPAQKGFHSIVCSCGQTHNLNCPQGFDVKIGIALDSEEDVCRRIILITWAEQWQMEFNSDEMEVMWLKHLIRVGHAQWMSEPEGVYNKGGTSVDKSKDPWKWQHSCWI